MRRIRTVCRRKESACFLDDPKVKIDIYDELESTNQTAKKEAMMERQDMGHLSLPGARLQAGGAEAGNSILLQIQVFT